MPDDTFQTLVMTVCGLCVFAIIGTVYYELYCGNLIAKNFANYQALCTRFGLELSIARRPSFAGDNGETKYLIFGERIDVRVGVIHCLRILRRLDRKPASVLKDLAKASNKPR